jgi:hypothetical protein
MGRTAAARRWARPAALAALLAGCAAAPEASAPPRPSIASLWELAPSDASGGIVARDGALARVLEILDGFRRGPAEQELARQAKQRSLEPLMSPATWAAAGLDPSLGAAAFSWPDAGRGALLVLPVSDRARFRAAFHGVMRKVGEREVDDLGSGYVCAPTAGRYLCARATATIDAAVTPHASPLAAAVAELDPDDRGDLELYADARAPDLARARQQAEARAVGKLRGLSGAIKLRGDGAAARLHVFGHLAPALARGLTGAPPPPELSPTAAGAQTVVRFHVDPGAFPPSPTLDPAMRAELVDQLAGDLEIATGGGSFAGGSVIATLKDPARVEAFLKKLCAETGGTVRRYLLGQIKVRDHGCTAVLDPTLLLLPVKLSPVKLSGTVVDGRLVGLVGDAAEPSAKERSIEGLVGGLETRRALDDEEALVVFARNLALGPDVGAAAMFRAMSPLFTEERAAQLDALNDVGSRVFQVQLTARAVDGGAVASLDVMTFAADPPEARAAYDAALARRWAGDDAGYRAALAGIEAKFAGTRAARRAAEVRAGGPYLGAGALVLSALGSLARKKQ